VTAGPGTSDPARTRDEHLPDIDWAVPPAGSVRGWFRAPSGDLASLSIGDPARPRVVLVPGVTGSKEDFSFQLPELAAAGYFVQTYDLAGQYESWRAGPENLGARRRGYDWALFVDDLVAVLEAGRTPVHLLGYSFAGVVAQLVAVGRPDLVASLTLLSTPPLSGQSFRGVRIGGRLSGPMPAAVIAALMKWGIVVNVQSVPPSRLRFVRDRFRLTSPSSRRQVIALMKSVPDLRMDLRRLGIPIAVAVGTHDLWPLALHRRFSTDIGATIGVYRTGHSPCETAPHQLSRDLLALYEKAMQPG
jgi:pimeloyl-ACP methyl ester carboxylesterase